MEIVKMKGKTLAAGDKIRFVVRTIDNTESILQSKAVVGTVVYVHPKGRFLTAEYGPGLRECIYAPKMDKRGLASSVPEPVIRVTEEELEEKKEYRHLRRVSDDERQKIRELYKLGVPMVRIADRIGRTYKTVKSYLIEDGLKKEHAGRNEFTESEKRKMKRLRDEGKTYQEIARSLGRSATGVQRQLMKAREGAKRA